MRTVGSCCFFFNYLSQVNRLMSKHHDTVIMCFFMTFAVEHLWLAVVRHFPLYLMLPQAVCLFLFYYSCSCVCKHYQWILVSVRLQLELINLDGILRGSCEAKEQRCCYSPGRLNQRGKEQDLVPCVIFWLVGWFAQVKLQGHDLFLALT